MKKAKGPRSFIEEQLTGRTMPVPDDFDASGEITPGATELTDLLDQKVKEYIGQARSQGQPAATDGQALFPGPIERMREGTPTTKSASARALQTSPTFGILAKRGEVSPAGHVPTAADFNQQLEKVLQKIIKKSPQFKRGQKVIHKPSGERCVVAKDSEDGVTRVAYHESDPDHPDWADHPSFELKAAE